MIEPRPCIPEPMLPASLRSPELEAARQAIAARLLLAGHLTELDGHAFDLFCHSFVRYKDVMAWLARHGSEHPESAVRAEIAAEYRHSARAWAACFLLIPEERVDVGALTEDGLDEELIRWFGAAA